MATRTEPEAASGADGRPQRRRTSGGPVALIFALVVVGEVVVVVGVAGWVLLGARRDLEQARDDTVAGRAALDALELAAAERSFASAADGFDRGASALRNPAVRVTRVLPVIGSNVATTEALAVSGGLVAASARDVLATVTSQPGGLGAFLPVDGRFPVDRLAELASAAETADQRLADAAATIDGAPAHGLLGPVANARAAFVEDLDQARDLVGSAATASRELVTFLGADGPKRYLVGRRTSPSCGGRAGTSARTASRRSTMAAPVEAEVAASMSSAGDSADVIAYTGFDTAMALMLGVGLSAAGGAAILASCKRAHS